jgi:NAD-dependent dihydropyrimidine dehydrogenase PreA subunit
MQSIRYLDDVVTLTFDVDTCVGCGMCVEVCPHGVLAIKERKAGIVDRDGCMECGACAKNCPTGALTVTPGVGCAAYIIQVWIKGKENASCGGPGCC